MLCRGRGMLTPSLVTSDFFFLQILSPIAVISQVRYVPVRTPTCCPWSTTIVALPPAT